MKYIVMECHLSYAVLLDEEGRFVNAANLHYEVGQTVTDIIEMQVPEHQERPAKKMKTRWISLAATAACLALMAIPMLRLGQTPYASVYMTINPEVRIDVNRKEVVVGLDGVNSDGDTLIEDYRYKKKDLDLVMDELVDRAIDMGFLHEGGQITLTLDAEDGEWGVNRGETLSTHLNEHLSEKLSVTIEVSAPASNKHEVIIPVTPGSKGYGESDYGEASESQESPAALSNDSNYADSSYDDGQTDYDEPNDDGQSAYDPPDDDGQSSYDPPDDGQSAYDPPDDDGQPAYDPPDDDGQSVYDPPDDDDGQSAYDSPDDDEQSDHGSDNDD